MQTARKQGMHVMRLMVWLLLDLFGLLLFLAGALFLANGQMLFGRLPASLVEAAMFLVGGGVLMLIAAANLMRRLRRPAGAGAERQP